MNNSVFPSSSQQNFLLKALTSTKLKPLTSTKKCQQSGFSKLAKATSLSLLVLGLASCGGSGSSERSNNNGGETSTAIINQTSSVNLRRSVAASDGSAVVLDKVTPVSP